MRYYVLLGLVCVSCALGMSQEERQVFLHNDLHIPSTSESKFTIDTWPDNNCHPDNGCYAIIQLEELPDEAQVSEMNELGISLLEYIPNKSYLARYQGSTTLELPSYITAITSISGAHKRPEASLSSNNSQEDGEVYDLVAVPFPGVNTVQLSQRLISLGAQITAYYPEYIYYQILPELLPDVLACPQLMFTEPQPTPFVPEGQGANSNGRINSLYQGPGQGYDGTGVSMAIGDDGRVVHLDIKGRLIDHTQYNTGDHGELTVGMAAGAGNIDPSAQGAAPGATVHLFDINPHEHLLNAIANYQQDRIVVTSTSYGDGCGDSYYIPAQSIDAQVSSLPVLLHFFSAGNHANDPCFNAYGMLGPAADGSYYNTITGGRKTAKNVMAIGNTYGNDLLVSSSSRGPTTDGRLKPDLVVQGQLDNTLGSNNTYRLSSGTSAAAPTAAGAATGLYQYYREANNGADPSSALIKAVMLNSADDLGIQGPDFSYGWGRLNAGKSLRVLQNQQYFSSDISHGQQQSFQLYIPPGTIEMKAMLYWHDPAGSLLSSRALVNDLDFSIQAPNNQKHLPWLPSHAAHLDSLSRPALPGVDRINNAEQVVLNNPVSGIYNLQVNGFQIPLGPQNFYIVYELIQTPMAFTFPEDGSTFVPNEQVIIGWDATGNAHSFGLDFSIDGGQSWQVIDNAIAGSSRNYQWYPPYNTSSSQLKFRLRRTNQQIISTGQAVLSAVPEFSISYQDANHAVLSWDAIPNASEYRIYLIGERYMGAIGSSTSTTYQAAAVVGEEYWYSVAPVFANNQEGRRAIAKYYEHYGCESNVRLSLQFDRYPGETAWSILDSDGEIRHSGGPYIDNPAHSFLEEIVCLPPGCFTLVVTDAYSDGMCCENGDGWFLLTDSNGNELASGGDFSSMSYQLFCVEPDQQSELSLETTIVNAVSCNGATDGTAYVTASGGTGNYTYNWSNNQNSPILNNVAAGQYTVTVSDGQQTAVASLTIEEPTAIIVNINSQAANCQDGIIVLQIFGGQAPYDINWSDGASGTVRTGLSAGDYFAIVQDSNGCLSSVSVNVAIGSPLLIQLDGQAPSCSAENSGAIQASISGGSGNYQIIWSNGEQNTTTINGLNSGTYSITVIDGICTQSASITLDAPSGYLANLISSPPSCSDSQDGLISAAVFGGLPPFSYQWSNGATTSTIFNVTPGFYQVTISDALGCTIVRNTTLTAPTPLLVSANIQNATPDTGGSISLDISGGTADYAVLWDHGAVGAQLFNLLPASYQAQVIDQSNCSTSITVIVEYDEPSNPEPHYCPVTGVNTNYEWIEAVIFNNETNTSGNDSGYGDYTNIIFEAISGTSQSISLHTGYSSTVYREYWAVWIDYNNDQDFTDLGEKVLALGPEFNSVSSSFQIPANIEGSRRMRVSMQYGSSPSPCANPSYGEVEEYTIAISPANDPNLRSAPPSLAPLTTTSPEVSTDNWSAFPNPSSGWIQLEGESIKTELLNIEVYDLQGKLIQAHPQQADQGFFKTNLDISQVKPGLYMIRVTGQDWSETIRILKIQ